MIHHWDKHCSADDSSGISRCIILFTHRTISLRLLLGFRLAQGQSQLQLFFLFQFRFALTSWRLTLLRQWAAQILGRQIAFRGLHNGARIGLVHLDEARVADTNVLLDAKLGQGASLRGALGTENLTTIAAMVFPLRERELDATMVTAAAVMPGRCRVRSEHRISLFQLRKNEAFCFKDGHRVFHSLVAIHRTKGESPGLDQLQHLDFDILVGRGLDELRERLTIFLNGDLIMHRWAAILDNAFEHQ